VCICGERARYRELKQPALGVECAYFFAPAAIKLGRHACQDRESREIARRIHSRASSVCEVGEEDEGKYHVRRIHSKASFSRILLSHTYRAYTRAFSSTNLFQTPKTY